MRRPEPSDEGWKAVIAFILVGFAVWGCIDPRFNGLGPLIGPVLLLVAWFLDPNGFK